VPAESTISRILTQRGFVVPAPAKRPKSSYVRFEAALPNECWQADVTHWHLAAGIDVEILNVIDDYSRLCVAADARWVTDTHGVLEAESSGVANDLATMKASIDGLYAELTSLRAHLSELIERAPTTADQAERNDGAVH
jgi:hypothetical protein